MCGEDYLRKNLGVTVERKTRGVENQAPCFKDDRELLAYLIAQEKAIETSGAMSHGAYPRR